MLILYFLPSKGNQIVISAYFARNVDDTLVSVVFVVVVVGAVLFLTCHHTIKSNVLCNGLTFGEQSEEATADQLCF